MKLKIIVCSAINGSIFGIIMMIAKIDLYSKKWFELFLLYFVTLLNCMIMYSDT